MAGLESYLVAAVAFVLGASVGSFLNVVIYRVPRGGSVTNPSRSFCPRCESTIPWYCNIPIVSWLALRGKCLRCRAPIAIQYPIIETVTALAYTATAMLLRNDSLMLIACCWMFVSGLIVVATVACQRESLPKSFMIAWLATGAVCLVQLLACR